jgi:hypothetical protein
MSYGHQKFAKNYQQKVFLTPKISSTKLNRFKSWSTDRHRQTDRQTDKQTNRQTNRQTDKQTNRQTDKQTDRQTDRWTDGWLDGQMNRQHPPIPIRAIIFSCLNFLPSISLRSLTSSSHPAKTRTDDLLLLRPAFKPFLRLQEKLVPSQHWA